MFRWSFLYMANFAFKWCLLSLLICFYSWLIYNLALRMLKNSQSFLWRMVCFPVTISLMWFARVCRPKLRRRPNISTWFRSFSIIASLNWRKFTYSLFGCIKATMSPRKKRKTKFILKSVVLFCLAKLKSCS